jgi:membrane protein DedA with SNARE-associated domain
MIDLSQLDVSSPVSYLVAVFVPALDAILPVLPSETAIIALGVATAGSEDPRIGLLVLLAALGAFIGDNVNYLIGRYFGPAVERRFFSSEKGQARLAWARKALDRFGARIIIGCRFIPGGRTVVTLTCGLVRYQRRSYVIATACAAIIWASYAFFIGRLGGQVFEDKPWIGLLLAFGAAVAISVVIEVLRRTRPWRVLSRFRDPHPGHQAAQDPARASRAPDGAGHHRSDDAA